MANHSKLPRPKTLASHPWLQSFPHTPNPNLALAIFSAWNARLPALSAWLEFLPFNQIFAQMTRQRGLLPYNHKPNTPRSLPSFLLSLMTGTRFLCLSRWKWAPRGRTEVWFAHCCIPSAWRMADSPTSVDWMAKSTHSTVYAQNDTIKDAITDVLGSGLNFLGKRTIISIVLSGQYSIWSLLAKS